MKVVQKVVEIYNLSTIQLKKNNHELDHIEKIFWSIPISLPPSWILNGGPLTGKHITSNSWCSYVRSQMYYIIIS